MFLMYIKREPNPLGRLLSYIFHRLVLSQAASVVTARVASGVTATIRGSAVVVDVVVLRPRIRCSLGCSNLSLGLVGPCQLHILLQLVTSGFFPALFFMFFLKELGSILGC